MANVLDCLAIHFVDKQNNLIRYSPNVQEFASLNETIVQFFEALTKKLWDAEDSGNTVSGHFDEGVNPSRARPFIEEILNNPNTLFSNSINLANLLFQVSPNNASAGILAVLTCHDSESNTVHVAIYKIKCGEERFIRILSGENLPELSVEDVDNILLRELQKGALIPHPNRSQYELKITDLQAVEPTRYFGSNFLGCVSKKSDEHQIKKLIPELLKFGNTNGIHVNTERLPSVISSLGEIEGIVTIPEIVNVVEEKGLYDEAFTRETFTHFVEQSTDLRNFDVEPRKLTHKKGGETRKLTYIIRDANFNGIVISGPPEAMERIRTTEGDTVIIRLEIVEANLEIKYE